MPVWLSSAFVVCSLFAVPSCAAETRGDAAVWHQDYEQARALARRTSRPLFVVFR